MCEASKRKFILRDPLQTTNAQLSKLLRKKKRQSKSSLSDVPQLGAQKKQSIEPLVVGQTTQQQDFVTFLKEANLTAAQIAGEKIFQRPKWSSNGRLSWANLLYPRSSDCASNANV